MSRTGLSRTDSALGGDPKPGVWALGAKTPVGKRTLKHFTFKPFLSPPSSKLLTRKVQGTQHLFKRRSVVPLKKCWERVVPRASLLRIPKLLAKPGRISPIPSVVHALDGDATLRALIANIQL